MSSKNRKMQRKLEREVIKNKRISELKKRYLGFLGLENLSAVQIGKTEIIVEAMQSNLDKFVELQYQSLGISKEVLDRHNNTSYAASVTALRESFAKVEYRLEFPKVME